MTLTIENMFDPQGRDRILARVNALTPAHQPVWGKMNVAQMLAHCNVTYETVHEPGKHRPPGFIGRVFARVVAKPMVTGNRPYPKGSPTAPMFVISESKDFEAERDRLIGYIHKTFEQGAQHYEGRESMSFGKLSAKAWNTLFSKHLDHHLRQFGV